MFNIAICEDNGRDALLLRQLLQEYLSENGAEGNIELYESGEAFLEAFRARRYQLVFLDIYLTGMDGMEVARRLREQDADVALVFLTISRTHAVESYTVQASYYLNKPVDYTRLSQAMKQCEPVLEEYNHAIEVMSNREPVKVPVRDILYIETYQRSSVIYTTGGEVKTAATMDALEGQLGGIPFFRCHRGFLINMWKILRLNEKEIVMINGAHIPMGRTYTEEFSREYSNFALALARKKQL